MCQIQVTLAERGRARYVTQCEHGTVHIEFLQIGLAVVLLAIVYWLIDLVKKSRP